MVKPLAWLGIVVAISMLLSACQSGLTEVLIYTPTPAVNSPQSVSGVIAPSNADEPLEGVVAIPTQLESFLAVENPVTNLNLVLGIPTIGDYEWKSVARGFDSPTYITSANDGSGRTFVVEQRGVIWELDENFVRTQTPFLDISSRVSLSFEQGMWSLAFHPQYAQNGYLYVTYSNLLGSTVVSRFLTDRNTNRPNPVTELILFSASQPADNHNGGQVAFGPDGFLYIGLGDGGSAGDPWENAQSLDSPLGKILRVDVNSGARYSIPQDNPFVDGNVPEVWALGFQNPWRFSFDRDTGDLFISDVGESEWQEISYVLAGTPGGLNFGWNAYEGRHAVVSGTPGAGFVQPVLEYSRNNIGCSVIGGHIYRGAALPEWNGVYLYGDFCTGSVWAAVKVSEQSWRSQLVFNLNTWISSFGLDEAGELYLTDYENGDIYRLSRR
jgi:glucose/arabinose dehydrogenase